MTIAELVAGKLGKQCKIIDIISFNCPSDYGYENIRGCYFRKTGCASALQCVKCWTRKYREKDSV